MSTCIQTRVSQDLTKGNGVRSHEEEKKNWGTKHCQSNHIIFGSIPRGSTEVNWMIVKHQELHETEKVLYFSVPYSS